MDPAPNHRQRDQSLWAWGLASPTTLGLWLFGHHQHLCPQWRWRRCWALVQTHASPQHKLLLDPSRGPQHDQIWEGPMGWTPHTMEGCELKASLCLCRHLRLEDTFEIWNHSFSFSWDNKRHFTKIPPVGAPCVDRILHRIDCCYVANTLPRRFSSTILLDIGLSNHAPVQVLCNFNKQHNCSSIYHMNVKHLQNLDLQ